MNQWFGEDWGAPACKTMDHVATPVGVPCLWCDEPIVAGDQGIMMMYLGAAGAVAERKPWHVECFTRSLIGGVNHLTHKCRCYGGDQPPDPPDVSKHEAAKMAEHALRSDSSLMKRPPETCEEWNDPRGTSRLV